MAFQLLDLPLSITRSLLQCKWTIRASLIICLLVITGATNEESLAVDGPQWLAPSLRLPPPQPDKTFTTDDGRRVPQYADLIVAQSTWSGIQILQWYLILWDYNLGLKLLIFPMY